MNSRLRRNIVSPSSLLVAWVAGAVLLAGAMLKGHQLATEPIVGNSILDSKWLLSAVVCGELLLGLMLLLFVMPRLAWKSATICFSGFAGVSAYRQASGHESCGCFGRWSPPPWVTLGLDAAILFALLNAQVPSHTQRTSLRRLGLAGAAFLAIAVTGGIAIASFSRKHPLK